MFFGAMISSNPTLIAISSLNIAPMGISSPISIKEGKFQMIKL